MSPEFWLYAALASVFFLYVIGTRHITYKFHASMYWTHDQYINRLLPLIVKAMSITEYPVEKMIELSNDIEESMSARKKHLNNIPSFLRKKYNVPTKEEAGKK